MSRAVKQDSIDIVVKLPARNYLSFYLIDDLGDIYPIRFYNNEDKGVVMTKCIFPDCDNMVMNYSYDIFYKNSVRVINHNYLINKNSDKVEFVFNKGDIHLKNIQGVVQIDSLYDIYENTHMQSSVSEDEKIEQLDSIYKTYNKKYLEDKQPLLAELNYLLYLDRLTILNPYNTEVDRYLKGIENEQIRCGNVISIFYFYIRSRVKTDGFDKILNLNSSEEYKKHLSVAVYHFLKNEEIIGNKIYDRMRSWLKTTDTYKNNITIIDKWINSTDNTDLKI